MLLTTMCNLITPTSASIKNTMEKCVTDMKIPIHRDMCKTQLYDVIKLHGKNLSKR